MSTVPEIYSDSDMELEYEGEVYSIESGLNYYPDIEITEGEHTMTFTGNGIVSVIYRGGSL